MLCILLLLLGCTTPEAMTSEQEAAAASFASVAGQGDMVTIDFVGTADGKVFYDTSKVKPVTFVLGKGELIQSLQNAIVGMKVGETKTVTLYPRETYGDLNPTLVFDVERSKFGNHTPLVGKTITINHPSGKKYAARIDAVSATTVTVNANHPLAGKTLTFEVALREVK